MSDGNTRTKKGRKINTYLADVLTRDTVSMRHLRRSPRSVDEVTAFGADDELQISGRSRDYALAAVLGNVDFSSL